VGLADLPRRLQAVHLGHPYVDQGDVRLFLVDQIDQFLPVGRLADDLDPLRHVQVPAESLPHERVVVGDRYPNRHASPSGASTAWGPSYMDGTTPQKM
jgi:hypothetical protein